MKLRRAKQFWIISTLQKYSARFIAACFCAIFTCLAMLSHSINEMDYTKSHGVIKYFEEHNITDHAEIIYVEVAGTPFLNPRAACSIESAARHNPFSKITLYNKSLISENTAVKTLLQLPNFAFSPLNLTKEFLPTPLSKWYQDGIYEQSLFPIIKLSDAVRTVLLWNKGGIYLDMDVIVLRPISRLRNAIGLENIYGTNNAILAFDKHSSVLKSTMNEFLKVYSNYKWGSEGPYLFTRILHQICANRTRYISLIHPLSEFVMNPGLCNGVHILPRHSFYPIEWPTWPQLFSVISDYKVLLKNSYTVHLWNSLSNSRHSVLGSGELLDVLARENCPHIYKNVLKTIRNGL